jgi:hypothetical protein
VAIPPRQPQPSGGTTYSAASSTSTKPQQRETQVCAPHGLDFTYRLGYEGLPPGEAAVCERQPSEYLSRNLYVDTMGFWAPHVREAIEVLGADRVLLGSDFGPVPISPAKHVDLVRSLGRNQADEERVLGRNAEQLFGLH